MIRKRTRKRKQLMIQAPDVLETVLDRLEPEERELVERFLTNPDDLPRPKWWAAYRAALRARDLATPEERAALGLDTLQDYEELTKPRGNKQQGEAWAEVAERAGLSSRDLALIHTVLVADFNGDTVAGKDRRKAQTYLRRIKKAATVGEQQILGV